MRIREYQLDKIDEARRIQQECLRLHLPCPPVLHWGYEIKEPDGEVVEIGRGKANSYTRNALNLLAFHLSYPNKNKMDTLTFGDGYISFKDTGGTVVQTAHISNSTLAGYYGLGRSSLIPNIVAGTGGTIENIDIIALAAKIAGGWELGTTDSITTWDSTTRKLTTVIHRDFTNQTGGSIIINEVGIESDYARTYYESASVKHAVIGCLVVYDLLSGITVESAQTLNYTYTVEVAF